MERKLVIIQLIGAAIAGFFSAVLAVIGLKKEIKAPKTTTESTETVKETPVEQPKNDKFLK